MYKVANLFYFVAGAEFAREGQSTSALIAVVLLGWAIVIGALAFRVNWQIPNLDRSGYGGSLSHRDVEFLDNLVRLASFSNALRVGFALFGPLIFLWSLML